MTNFVSLLTAEYYYFITNGSCLLDYLSTLRGHVQNMEGILHPSTAQKFHTLLGSCLQTTNGHGLVEWDHLRVNYCNNLSCGGVISHTNELLKGILKVHQSFQPMVLFEDRVLSVGKMTQFDTTWIEW